jgi:hypothetical protein
MLASPLRQLLHHRCYAGQHNKHGWQLNSFVSGFGWWGKGVAFGDLIFCFILVLKWECASFEPRTGVSPLPKLRLSDERRPCSIEWSNTGWFKYDWNKLWLVYIQIVPVISEPPCIWKTEDLGQKSVSVTCCPQQIAHGLHWDWSWDSIVRRVFLIVLILQGRRI